MIYVVSEESCCSVCNLRGLSSCEAAVADAVSGACLSALSSGQKSYCPASVFRPEPAGRELSQIVAELIEKRWRETFSCLARL